MTDDTGRFQAQAEFCKAMAHPVRLQILDRLSRGGASVNELVKEIGVSQANLSQHLAVLRAHGAVRTLRAGNAVIYSLATPKIAAACGLVHEILAEIADRQQALVSVTGS